MPITLAFTLTSAASTLALLWLILRVRRRVDAYLRSGRNGAGKAAGDFLLRVVGTRLLASAMLMVAGVGLLFGIRPTGYLLAALPVLFLVTTLIDLRDSG